MQSLSEWLQNGSVTWRRQSDDLPASKLTTHKSPYGTWHFSHSSVSMFENLETHPWQAAYNTLLCRFSEVNGWGRLVCARRSLTVRPWDLASSNHKPHQGSFIHTTPLRAEGIAKRRRKLTQWHTLWPFPVSIPILVCLRRKVIAASRTCPLERVSGHERWCVPSCILLWRSKRNALVPVPKLFLLLFSFFPFDFQVWSIEWNGWTRVWNFGCGCCFSCETSSSVRPKFRSWRHDLRGRRWYYPRSQCQVSEPSVKRKKSCRRRIEYGTLGTRSTPFILPSYSSNGIRLLKVELRKSAYLCWAGGNGLALRHSLAGSSFRPGNLHAFLA